ncbi:transcriptional regulatory protein [Bradyrhizobiaceae bacterium SG-6C]|nr:transcriptional regulatory protein [Bradyrhizobiaceae bacterium SG-6C]
MGQMLPFILRNAPVVVVDDDPSVRDALLLLLRIDGFEAKAFGDGESFFESLTSCTPSCVILDLQLPGRSGLAVLKQLADIRFAPPVFVISGQSDIPMAVEAMKLGAIDFLEKPFSAGAMIDRVRDAVRTYCGTVAGRIDGLGDFPGMLLLTRRERDVLALVTNGASNKEAGRKLGISPRTVEVHRARIMDKLGARNAADLMRIVLSGEPAISRRAAPAM